MHTDHIYPGEPYIEDDDEEECEWSLDDSEEGNWITSCDNLFGLIDGTPEDNEMKFCCYCGKKLTQPAEGREEGFDID